MDTKARRLKPRPLLWIALSLVFLLSSAGFATAYLFGASKAQTAIYASLMSIDAQVKSQKETNFLHGLFHPKAEEIDAVSTYKYMLDWQRKTKFQYNFFNSFLVCSRQGNYLDFQTDYGYESVKEERSNLIEVSTYYDKDYMESIGIPLFNVGDKESRITPKNGAMCGTYISATHAEVIVKEKGYLATAEGDLKRAFQLLIQDNTYTFKLTHPLCEEGQPITCSVNNIYLDGDHNDMLNDFQKQVQTTRYGDYNKSFSHWFPNAIFSFSFDIFSKGSSYVFDVRRNYGNSDRFFDSVIGYDYGVSGGAVSLMREDKTIFEESATLNRASAEYNKEPRYLFLVASIASFLVIAIGFAALYRRLNKLEIILAVATPAAIFIVLQVVYYVLLKTSMGMLTLYQVFNSTGNIICLISMLALAAFACFWSIYARKRES